MAFFDDIGKKISQVGQSAAGKTRDTADLFKLKGEISDEEKKIESAYAEIGKLYYSLHSESYEPQFEGLIAGVKESIVNIETRRAQIQTIKKLTTCSKCGAEIPNENKFCTVCGTPRVLNPGDNICATCGKLVEAGNRFCIYCGTPVNVPDEVPPVGPVAVATETPEAPAAPVVPEVPAIPEAPVAPVVPEVPAIPEAPVVPVVPEVPAVFEVPAAPVVPEVPAVFEVPAAPVVPEVPAIPEAPAAPVVPTVAPDDEPTVSFASVETAPAAKLCKNCGNPVKEGNRFCIYCGAPVASVEVPADPFVDGLTVSADFVATAEPEISEVIEAPSSVKSEVCESSADYIATIGEDEATVSLGAKALNFTDPFAESGPFAPAKSVEDCSEETVGLNFVSSVYESDDDDLSVSCAPKTTSNLVAPLVLRTSYPEPSGSVDHEDSGHINPIPHAIDMFSEILE